jgi:hypothetical protein
MILAHPPLTGTRFSTVEYPALGSCSRDHKTKSLNITFLIKFLPCGWRFGPIEVLVDMFLVSGGPIISVT